MASVRERVAVLEARYERMLVLEAKQDTVTVYVKCIAYLMAALLTHVVGGPLGAALGSLLGAS